ncbi:flagellar filament capping protein FliD [Leclercia adecarboxylata]|uniref:Flagellar hook-associated protein 2 n=1 Tax=Leclercia adecarboxylata TaxID=83655 RepID=A0ABU6ICD3_9ENTR|nr:flagellar filament capping protein FliD [Leclercia adecarboxylata]MDV5241829.1 flagellar filament capping protein FliD [Leclercia adecarboxylata]MDV5280114.1 flagellar filament capping protein FliD [Leclercia adecarboxylata]MDV5464021.1 flagellar filament capping protein FliD [Leclercia adecarboxylata]MDV5505852.1 flagellar filament capping protein FliD [Leclercia adecarboxylata]MDV5565321.1 flagellar filament capping protein FliD [Leclercia adecarboxylata]
MATITNLGIGSAGLGDLYDQLETVERSKLTTITTQQDSYNAQLSAYGQLQSSMSALQTATAALSKTETWSSTSVSSTNTAFIATTTSDATVGNYTVNVKEVAKANVLTTGPITSDVEKLGGATGASRTISISQPGSDKPLEIELSDEDTSLTGIASAINKANGNVTASVIKAKDDDYRLMLTSKTSGTDSVMTVTVTGDNILQSVIGYDPVDNNGGMSVQTEAQNAVIVVNDIEIERQNNTISDAIPGVTFNVKAQSSADETLEISRATDENKKAITDWVNAYNTLQTTINTVTKYVAVDSGSDTQSPSNGALTGDSNVRNIQSQLRDMLTEVQTGSLQIMAQLGITQETSKGADGTMGTLKIDTDVLTKQLEDNPEAVQAYFIGDGKSSGLATTMNNTLTDMLSTSVGKPGIIQNAKDGINATLKSLDKRYLQMEASIEATMARYQAQFTNLDVMMTTMTNTASYLTQQFTKS